MKNIPDTVLRQAVTYAAYRQQTDRMAAEGKTSGENQTPELISFTALNQKRMRRLDKTTRLLPQVAEHLKGYQKPLIWLTITEAWCGDAAQILPVLNKMAEASEAIELKILYRDEHLDIIDAFLTNGARAIPKVIVLDADTNEVLDIWGPRPAEVQRMAMETKKEMESITDPQLRNATYEASAAKLQSWYARDKTKSIQLEMDALLHRMKTSSLVS